MPALLGMPLTVCYSKLHSQSLPMTSWSYVYLVHGHKAARCAEANSCSKALVLALVGQISACMPACSKKSLASRSWDRLTVTQSEHATRIMWMLQILPEIRDVNT